jgi:hypothetical protein
MYLPHIAITFIYLLITNAVLGQCTCTNCPITVPNSGIGTSDLDIGGLTDDQLGVNGQDICEVSIVLNSDAIEEIDLVLITPSGDQIALIERDLGFGVNQNLVFDIRFVPCGVTAQPDPGYPAVFDPNAYNFASNQTFTGTYYPSDGQCLEDFTGCANGTYTLRGEDFVAGDPHTIDDWELTFCNSAGLACNTLGACTSCDPGDLSTVGPILVSECEGSSNLLFDNLTPSWIGPPPPSTDYGVTYFVSDFSTGIVIERNDIIDLTTSPPGTYRICGLSYLLSDIGSLPPASGGYTIPNVQQDIVNDVFCGDLSDNCTLVTISPNLPAPTINWPATMCVGTTYRVPITNYDPSLTYQLATSSGAFATLFFDSSTGEIVINPFSDIFDINICVSIAEDCDNSQSCATINVLPAAATPILAGPIGVCTGNGGTVTVTNAQPGDTYSWTITGPGSITANNNDEVDFTTSGPGQITICADLTNACGTSQDCITITVTDPAPPSTNAQATYCLPMGFFAGNPNGGSTSMLWEQISGPGTITFFNASIVATSWTADLPGTYVVRLTKEVNGCITFDEATIELLPASVPPTLTGPFTFCDNVVSNVAITNPDPNTTYVWTTNGPGVIIADNGDNVDVEVTGNGSLQVCVDATNQCGTSSVCWTADATIPVPATANADPTYCMPGSTFFGSTNGSSNQIEYTQLSGPGTITFANPFAVQTAWTVDLPGTYTVELFKNFNNCDTVEIFSFDVFDAPTASEVVTCANGEFTIEITFTGGTAPYTVFGTVITGNVYTSPPYTSGTAVVTPYEDANGCGGDIFVQEFCSCVTDAGTMDATPIELCDETLPAISIFNNDATLDGNDIGEFILHTDAGSTLGAIIDRNATGTFTYQPSIVFGTTYYISYVVGDDDGSGSVDLADPCLSVALGQPVVWYPNVDIVAAIDSDPVTCDQSLVLGATYTLPVGLSGAAIWSTTSAPTGGLVTLASLTNDITTADFSEPGQYVMRFELTLGPCTYFDEVTIDVAPTFELSNVATTCDPANGTYTVSFDIEGGTPPYLVDGNSTSGSTYTSGPVTIGTPYSFTVTESSICNPIVESGTDNCGCISDAGSVPTGPITACSDQLATSTVSGSTLDNTDVGIYILHDAAGNVLGTILDQNTSGAFGLLPGMITGQTYYISYVVGNDDGSGGVDLNDPCLSVAPGTEVVWIDHPSVDLGPDLRSCSSSEVITALTDPGAIVTWTYNPTSPQQDGNLDDATPGILVFDGGSEGIHLIDATSTVSGCATTATISIEVLPQGQVTNISENCQGQDYTVSFDITGGTPPYSVDGAMITGSQYESGLFVSGDTYSLVVTDSNGCEIATIAGSRNCDCTTDAGTLTSTALEFCGTLDTARLTADGDAILDGNDAGVYVLHDGSPTVIGNILSQNTSGTFVFEAPLVVDTTYFITYVVGDNDGSGSIDLSDPCLDFTSGVPVTWYDDYDVLYADMIEQCFDTLLLTNQEQIPNVITEVRLLSGPGSITLVRDDSIGLAYTFDAPGNYLIETRNSRAACLDIDTINLIILEPLDFSGYQDLDVCQNAITVPAILRGQRLGFTSTNPSFTITEVGDSVEISSPLADVTTIIMEGPSFFCNDVDSFQLSITPTLEITEINFSCNADGSSAEVEVSVAGGDGTYTINGTTSGDATFVFTNVDPDLAFVALVSSGNCPPVSDTIVIDCDCSNIAPDLSIDTLTVCRDDSFTVDELVGATVSDGDTLLYILHSGSADSIGSILQFSASGTFVHAFNIAVPLIYWVTAYVGPVDQDGNPILDADCAVLGIIRLEGGVNLVLPPFGPICVGNSYNFSLIINGLFPQTVIISINGAEERLNVNAPGLIEFPVAFLDTMPITVVLRRSDDYPCSPVTITTTVQAEVCDCDIYSYSVPDGLCIDADSIDLQGFEAMNRPATYTLIEGNASLTGSNLVVDPSYEGQVTVIAEPQLFTACDTSYVLTFTAESKRALILSQDSLSICPEDDELINLDLYVFTASPIGSWSSGTTVDPSTLAVGSTTSTYTIATGDYCPSVSADFTITKTPPLDYTISSIDPDCEETQGAIDITLIDSTLLGSISLDGAVVSEDLLANLLPGSYQVVLSDVNNCTYSETLEITRVTPINVALASELNSEDGSEYIVTSRVDGGSGTYTYQWIIAGTVVTDETDFISLQITTDTEVQLIVSDAEGCSGTDTILLSLFIEPVPWVMPNIFNPNSTINSTITIPSNPDIVQVLQWQIYDRWGNLVFDAPPYDPNATSIGWSGDRAGTAVANGVYMYYIRYQSSDGTIKQKAGDITVLR